MKLEHLRCRYSATSQFFHWLSALLVELAWLLGQLRDDFERAEPRRIVLLIAAPAAGVVTLFAEGKPLPLFGLREIASSWVAAADCARVP
jgi:cytochrome b561